MTLVDGLSRPLLSALRPLLFFADLVPRDFLIFVAVPDPLLPSFRFGCSCAFEYAVREYFWINSDAMSLMLGSTLESFRRALESLLFEYGRSGSLISLTVGDREYEYGSLPGYFSGCDFLVGDLPRTRLFIFSCYNELLCLLINR